MNVCLYQLECVDSWLCPCQSLIANDIEGARPECAPHPGAYCTAFLQMIPSKSACRIQRFMLRSLHRDGAPVKEKLKPTSESSPWVKTNTAKITSGTFDTFAMFLLLFGTAHTQVLQWMCVQCSNRNLLRDLRQESIQSWTRSRIYLWARMTWMEHNLRQAWVVIEHSHFFTQTECSFGSLLEGFLHTVWNLMHP